MKRLFIAMPLAVLLMMGVVGCSSSDASKKPVTEGTPLGTGGAKGGANAQAAPSLEVNPNNQGPAAGSKIK